MYFENQNYGKNKQKLDNLISKVKIKSNDPEIIDISKNRRDNYNSRDIVQNSNNLFNAAAIPTNIINASTNKIFNWLGIPTKFDEMVYYAKWWKFYDNCVTLMNIFVVLLAFYDYDLNFVYPRKIIAEYNYIRLVMISLGITSILCVIRRHYMKNKWKNIKLSEKVTIDETYGGISQSIEDFFFEEENSVVGGKKAALLTPRMLFDILVNLVMPYPGMDFHIYIDELDRDANKIVPVNYLLSDFIYMIVLLRSLSFLRALVNYSIFADHYAYKVSTEYKVQNNFRFAIKCLLKIYHIKLVGWLLLLSVCTSGFMLRIFERPFWVQKGRIEFDSYLTPMWCSFITMLTIGYGDFAPLTTLGKIVIFVMSLWGVFICSLVVVSLHGLLEMSNDQFIVFTKILKSRCAVNLIESAYAFHKSKLLFTKNNVVKTKINYSTMIQNFNTFKSMRNESKSIYRSNGLLHYNMKLLKEMRKLNQRMDKLEIEIDCAKKKI